jgi:hypothetical protein
MSSSVGSRARVPAAAMLCLALVAGCGSDGDPAEQAASPPKASAAAEGRGAPPLPADAGTRAGHGADPARVEVPRADDTPPTGTIALVLPDGRVAAEASQPGMGPSEPVELKQPRLRGTMVGIDEDSGAVRVRVSIKESISCRSSTGRVELRQKVSYFPPSQIERATAAPGARIPARETRSRTLQLGRGRCPAGTVPTAVKGELWGDVTNGLGLEAVTPHIPLQWSIRRGEG